MDIQPIFSTKHAKSGKIEFKAKGNLYKFPELSDNETNDTNLHKRNNQRTRHTFTPQQTGTLISPTNTNFRRLLKCCDIVG